jgi:hypothetical protein
VLGLSLLCLPLGAVASQETATELEVDGEADAELDDLPDFPSTDLDSLKPPSSTAAAAPAAWGLGLRLGGVASYGLAIDTADWQTWQSRQSMRLALNLSSDIGVSLNGGLQLDPARLPDSLAWSVDSFQLQVALGDQFSLAAGRQALGWGNGVLFADLASSLFDSVGTSGTGPGLTGISGQLVLDSLASIKLLVLPDADLRWTQGALRAELTILSANLDLAIMVSKYNLGRLDGSGWQWSDQLALALDLAWAGDDFGLYLDAALAFAQQGGYRIETNQPVQAADMPTLRVLAGLHWQLDSRSGSNLRLEYLYNGNGLSTTKRHQLILDLASATSPDFILHPTLAGEGSAQHYLALSLSQLKLAEDLHLAAQARYSPDGDTYSLGAGLNCKLSQAVMLNLQLGHQGNFGSDSTSSYHLTRALGWASPFTANMGVTLSF